MMKIAHHANKVLNNKDSKDQTLKQTAIDDMAKVHNYLHTNLPVEQNDVFIDTAMVAGLSPKTQKIAPSKDFNFVDIRNYEFDPTRDSLPNDILLDGVNLSNLVKRLGASSSKGKFIAGIAMKLAKESLKGAGTLTFHLVKYGSKLAIAAVKNPSITSTIVGGGGLVYLGKTLWKGRNPTENEITEVLTDNVQNLLSNNTVSNNAIALAKNLINPSATPKVKTQKNQNSILLYQDGGQQKGIKKSESASKTLLDGVKNVIFGYH